MSDLVGNPEDRFSPDEAHYTSTRRSIAQRSAILIDKLKRADIGNRPIIWVGHSMGGMHVKLLFHILPMFLTDRPVQTV